MLGYFLQEKLYESYIPPVYRIIQEVVLDLFKV